MDVFNQYNTEYSDAEIHSYNSEWENLVESLGLEEGTDEYDFQLKVFSEQISRR